jgi:hypothetical protein
MQPHRSQFIVWQGMPGQKGARTNLLGNQLTIHRIKTMAFTTTIPILRILDETTAKEFYVDFLGFMVDWEHRAEGLSITHRIARLAASGRTGRSL